MSQKNKLKDDVLSFCIYCRKGFYPSTEVVKDFICFRCKTIIGEV